MVEEKGMTGVAELSNVTCQKAQGLPRQDRRRVAKQKNSQTGNVDEEWMKFKENVTNCVKVEDRCGARGFREGRRNASGWWKKRGELIQKKRKAHNVF